MLAIKNRLEEIRLERRLDKKELAELTGVHENTIYLICNNKSQSISFPVIDKILNGLKIGISDLLIHDKGKAKKPSENN